MSKPYDQIIDDDRLIQAFREVFGQSMTFDMEAEIRKANEAWNAGARIADNCHCPTCGKRGVIRCDCERG